MIIQSGERESKALENEDRSIGLLEILSFGISETMTENWFSNVVKVFSAPVINDENLVNFILERGNPYFLAHVIDTENRSAVYLSATKDEIRISPVYKETNVATVSKIIRILQRYVDPTMIPRIV
jgi:hypothetical protein